MSEPNLIKCPVCNKEVSAQATNCPNCGQPINPIAAAKKGKPVLTVILLIFLCPIGIIVMWATKTFSKTARIIITLLFAAALVVFFTSGTKTQKAPESISDISATEEEVINETTAKTPQEETQQNIALGSEGSIAEGLSLVVNSVAEADSISAAGGYMSYKPDSGKYAIVNVTIKNTSKTSQNLLLNYFNLVDNNGAKYVSTIIVAADDKYITVDTVNPNLDITGNLVFEVPTDASVGDFLLEYSDFNIFSGVQHFSLK